MRHGPDTGGSPCNLSKPAAYGITSLQSPRLQCSPLAQRSRWADAPAQATKTSSADGVTKTLDAFKNPTKENLTPYIGELDTDQVKQLEAYGLDVYEFFGHAFKNFDYQLGDIAVDGDKATVAVKVQNTDVSKVARGVIDKVQNDESIAAEVQKIAEKGDQAEVMKFVFSLIYEELDATTETATTDVQLTLTKTNNEWRIDEDSFYTMVNGMYGGMEV